MSNIVKR